MLTNSTETVSLIETSSNLNISPSDNIAFLIIVRMR